MDFNLISIFMENFILVIVLLLLAIICRRIYNYFLSDKVVMDVTKTKWMRNIPPNVFENQGDILPENLTGWFPLFASSDVKLNHVKGTHAFGMDLLVFRSSSGKIHVLDAYCPHMGTYLPIGGKVVGESVRCPFHGWTFNGEGECTHVPGLNDSSLPRAKIKTWMSREINGLILIWYDSEDSPPTWTPKKNTEIELIYNASDLSHFELFHTDLSIIDPDSVFQQNLFYRIVHRIFKIGLKPEIKFDQVLKHSYTLTIKFQIHLFGFIINTKTKLVVGGEGPYILHWSLNGGPIEWAKIRLVQTVQPIPGRKFRIISYHYSKPTLFARIVSVMFARFEAFQLLKDGIIWSNKVMLKRPYFAKHEKDMVEMKRFLNQFSPKDEEN